MRIMHVASKDLPVPPIRGGAIQLWIDKVSRILAGYEGAEVAVVSPWDARLPEKEKQGSLEHRRIRFSRPYVRVCRKWLGIDPRGYPWRVAREAAGWRADIVHLHGGGSLWLPHLRKRLPHTPIVIHLHNDPCQELHKWPWRDWRNISFLACSRYIAEVSVRGLEIPEHQMDVLWNGADADDFVPRWLDEQPRRTKRQALGIPEDAVVLLFCGRVAPEKGPHLLAAAAAELMAAHPDLWCVFAGDYHDKPVAKKEEWHQTYAAIAGSLGAVWNRVRFTGALPAKDMPVVFAAGDIFVGPAQWDEPFGMVYVEAMAAGLPVAACPRGGIPEIVTQDTGCLVADVAALRAALVPLVQSADLRQRMGMAGRQRAEACFAWPVLAQQLQRFYGGLLPGCDARARPAAGSQ